VRGPVQRRLVLAGLVALAWPTLVEARDPLFPPEGCSPTGLVNSCHTWAPAPIGDPTDGPLTDTLRDGPLDPPEDPLGLDGVQPKARAPLLTPAKDRLGVGTKDPLGVGR
jgi:hypothetical protein